MAHFIQIPGTKDIPARLNVDCLVAYFPHEHTEQDCEDSLGACLAKTDLLVAGVPLRITTRLDVQELDRLIDPTRTP